MARTTTQQTPVASQSKSAGSADVLSSWLAINYGVSGVGKVVNGATGPTIACSFIVQVSADGGSTIDEWGRWTAGTANNGSYSFSFGLGPGGLGGDFTHYRIVFSGNTGQAVTISCDACTTTAY